MSDILRWPTKDPDEVLPYELAWAKRLAGADTIASSSWEISGAADGLLVMMSDPAPSHTDTSTFVWLSGGTAGQTYKLTNTVTLTTQSQAIMQQSVIIAVEQK